MCTATGLFLKKGEAPQREVTQEAIEAHRELRDVFLEHSRKTMSHIIARYL